MQFLNKIFGHPSTNEASKPNPDNEKLFELLEEYIKDNKYDNYLKVASELVNGNAYLLIPSYGEIDNNFNTWTPVTRGLKMNLRIYDVDGLKAIAAFTSETALFAWAKKPSKYISLESKGILQICEENDIRRIVIDSKLRTMFVLQCNTD